MIGDRVGSAYLELDPQPLAAIGLGQHNIRPWRIAQEDLQ
jgi:hypothetical protein